MLEHIRCNNLNPCGGQFHSHVRNQQARRSKCFLCYVTSLKKDLLHVLCFFPHISPHLPLAHCAPCPLDLIDGGGMLVCHKIIALQSLGDIKGCQRNLCYQCKHVSALLYTTENIDDFHLNNKCISFIHDLG